MQYPEGVPVSLGKGGHVGIGDEYAVGAENAVSVAQGPFYDRTGDLCTVQENGSRHAGVSAFPNVGGNLSEPSDAV